MARNFVGRFGQPVTAPEAIEARKMLVQLRRLETVHAKSGRAWPKTVHVGELAVASKMTVDHVIAVVRRYADPWLLDLIEVGTPADWWVYQDGE
jgi:hypothetical protein